MTRGTLLLVMASIACSSESSNDSCEPDDFDGVNGGDF
jgi:hypothetical protein